MPIRIDIPPIIQEAIGQSHLSIDGVATLGEALHVAAHHPKAGVLLFDESLRLREKLLLIVNGKLTRDPSMRIGERDEIEIVMSVWGG